MIPDALRSAVEARLGPVRGVAGIAGGCISRGVRLDLSGGRVFLKHNDAAPAGMFSAEARGLEALADAAVELAVPRPLAWAEARDGAPAWIALEWVEPAARQADFGERLGHGLAVLHRVRLTEDWGWGEDNFIGSLPQQNGPADTWAEFWRVRRLQPQLDRAREAGRLPGREADWERLWERLPEALAPAERDGPSLLHGDLWSGNVLAAAGGPALIDPAVYRGHREADLAMAELFGGFDDEFYVAYRDAWPLRAGYATRRAIYQLWYLLVHVNLFGGPYVRQTAGVLQEALIL